MTEKVTVSSIEYLDDRLWQAVVTLSNGTTLAGLTEVSTAAGVDDVTRYTITGFIMPKKDPPIDNATETHPPVKTNDG